MVYALFFIGIIGRADKKQVCVFGTPKLPRLGRGKLALRPVVAKVFWGYPGDFGAVGARSIVIQSFILLNAKKHFLPSGQQDRLWHKRTSC